MEGGNHPRVQRADIHHKTAMKPTGRPSSSPLLRKGQEGGKTAPRTPHSSLPSDAVHNQGCGAAGDRNAVLRTGLWRTGRTVMRNGEVAASHKCYTLDEEVEVSFTAELIS